VRRIKAGVVALLPAVAGAGDWQRLDGPAIRAALEMKDVRYADGSEQLFFLGGITRFSHGWPNEGRWKVAGDQYCALWPPAQDWGCYDVARGADGRLRFEGPDHRVMVGEVMGAAKWP
jgi:hypothetical protein